MKNKNAFGVAADEFKRIREEKGGTPAHTPTPWKLLAGTYYDGAERKIVSGDRNSSLYVLVGGSEGIRDENAALIVRAVNAHEELLHTLKVALTFFDPSKPIAKSICQAIARAEGQ